ncbi:hypothetical protein M4R22_04255 [Acidovorax sp. GBBC 3334]|uniref:hypothetical protein n=1 Tax=Acidovorax sp. GBBC 3334 TaxID=2940496 RepID=UPI002304C92D|nr:hypothetical protein [Acidovorax sp. GBBC 3334]MDA8453969.1 hypothetical protein [Acidovorax sp. GBBC 3334]
MPPANSLGTPDSPDTPRPHSTATADAGTPPPALQGPLLDAYLDEAEAIAADTDAGTDDGTGADLPRQQALAAMLGRQPLHPDALDALHRIHALWLEAGRPNEALAALDRHGEALVQDLPAAERHDARVDLVFARVQSQQARHGDTPDIGHPEAGPALAQALAAAERLLSEPPVADQSDRAWEHLAAQAGRSRDFPLARRCAAARLALQQATPGRAAFRAWDSAVAALRTGTVHAAEGDAALGRQAAQQAMDHLRMAEAGQDVDHEDWLNLGPGLIALDPEGIATVAQQVERLLPADTPRPRRRDVAVRLARLQARALHAQGRREEALSQARQGRFGLTGDADDGFTCHVLDWLIEAGRDADAARLAFECTDNQRPRSAQYACRLALERQAAAQSGQAGDAAPSVYWTLALAAAALHEEMHWVAAPQPVDAFFDAQLALARASAPTHPAIGALQAQWWHARGAESARVLPLLEAAAREPALAHPGVLQALWLHRVRAHGIEAALQQPFAGAPAAGWCYHMGTWIDHHLHGEAGAPEGWPERAVSDLAARYYELALTHFEAFFATGEGWFRDGDVHVYAMLCNNLAIYRRWALQQYDRAVELHHKGLAASPFAEHHHGLMHCYEQSDRKAEFVAAADTLWHFAAEHGYGRHDPTEYFDDVGSALYDLDRDNEIAIWLQRLDEWWNGLDDEDRGEHRTGFLATQLLLLRYMAWTQPADALARLEPMMDTLRAAEGPRMRRLAGAVFEYARDHARAMALYRESLQAVRPGEESDAREAGYTRERMAQCQKAMRAARPWWKFW